MEWTLDQSRLYENPLMTIQGQQKIQALCKQHQLSVDSLTGDCFMQAPFWKAPTTTEYEKLVEDFRAIINACHAVEIKLIVVPLVDNGSLTSTNEENNLVSTLEAVKPLLANMNVKVVFESDFSPPELTRFIDRLEPELFGINYDIGNSASLGMNPREEIASYGHRILNVHIKDRVLGGTTVPLGQGNADFETVFAELGKIGYRGNYILQTARASNNEHAQVLCQYREMATNWIQRYGA
jgi:hexulose-6-phosphate isomerase